jgi:hypothetical protein
MSSSHVRGGSVIYGVCSASPIGLNPYEDRKVKVQTTGTNSIRMSVHEIGMFNDVLYCCYRTVFYYSFFFFLKVARD